jgi:hypothetical protein
MGINNSKKKKIDGMPEPFIPTFIKTEGDIKNEALLQFCINNDTSKITSALRSNTDIASPYKNCPLIISALLALLNDEDKDRFECNWNIIAEFCKESVPLVKELDVRLTNFTESAYDKRSTCYPIIHINGLSKEMVETDYKYPASQRLGQIRNSNLNDILLLVMTKVKQTLKDMTQPKAAYTTVPYANTKTEHMEEIIKRNAQYVLDNINDIRDCWDDSLNERSYYEKYNKEYSMDEVPMATVADSVDAK